MVRSHLELGSASRSLEGGPACLWSEGGGHGQHMGGSCLLPKAGLVAPWAPSSTSQLPRAQLGIPADPGPA